MPNILNERVVGIPFMSLPEEERPSDFGHMVVTDDVRKLKKITKGNFFKGKFSGGNVLSGRGEPDNSLGHDGDVYVNLGTDITTITDFRIDTDNLQYVTWDVKYDDPGTDNGWYYEMTSFIPYAAEHPHYYSENGVVNNILIRNRKDSQLQSYLSPQLIEHFEDDLSPHIPRGGIVFLRFYGLVEGEDYPVKYPKGIYNISFDLVIPNISGMFRPNRTEEKTSWMDSETHETYFDCEFYIEPYIGITNFSTNWPPAGNKRRYWYEYWNTNGFNHTKIICKDPDDPEHYNQMVYNGYGYSTVPGDHDYFIPIETEPGTYHIDFTSYVKSNLDNPYVIIDLGALRCDPINGGPGYVTVNNLRITPATIYAESIQDIWVKQNGIWCKDQYTQVEDIEIKPTGSPGTTIARMRYKSNTYFLTVPNTYHDMTEVGITREYSTGTELFYMDIDGQRTRVYNPPTEFEMGYKEGSVTRDPNNLKIYTDRIRTLAINTLKKTYTGSANFLLKRNGLYKVVCRVYLYQNESGSLNITGNESFYAKLDIPSSVYGSWVDGPLIGRVPARDHNGTRFAVYMDLIGYFTSINNIQPAFSLDVGGTNFTSSNSYEIMVYYSIAITRIK